MARIKPRERISDEARRWINLYVAEHGIVTCANTLRNRGVNVSKEDIRAVVEDGNEFWVKTRVDNMNRMLEWIK